MSGDAASLPCPICSHVGVFNSVKSLRDRLISVSTNKILCPVCQEEVSGLDKLTIHLFSHVKIIACKSLIEKHEHVESNCKMKTENQVSSTKTQQKKPRQAISKNKATSPASNTPVKFVKIYPKLPVVSLNPTPVIDICRRQQGEENSSTNSTMDIAVIKKEAVLIPTNTLCNVCGLQFVDANILRMHKCLIHNIDENSNQTYTRYHCHLCSKNFKMRGSLMVHLRVAHFGFSSNNSPGNNINTEEKNSDHVSDDKPAMLERNDNKQWQCDVCRKCFTTKYFLKKHKRLHTGETPYACTQCNKTFTFQQSYHKHLLYHNDEKPHSCNYCGRAFKELSTLHNHQRIHTGEKPFSCETCGKCFRQRVSYLVHRRIHTGAMPYKCTSCGKSFRYKVSQRTHKCQALPPGTVVRQAGDLVVKLMKKHDDTEIVYRSNQNIENDNIVNTIAFPEVSEANAELVRKGAKLSLEDMESVNFSLIGEPISEKNNYEISSSTTPGISNTQKTEEENLASSSGIDSNIFDSIPVVDNSVPSPSEIFKNLCLSKEDDFIAPFQERLDECDYDISKDFNAYL